MISVALQVPESEGEGPTRLTDKFPSTTTLWLLLRKFESGASPQGIARNFTARASPQVDGGEKGPGRLFYETPVIHVMGRELASFSDLQKNFSQLGFNSGSVLLRLSFRATQTPLEDAMMQIEQYFKSSEGASTGGAHSIDLGNSYYTPHNLEPVLDDQAQEKSPPLESSSSDKPESPLTKPLIEQSYHKDGLAADPPFSADQIVTGPGQRPITVFSPPTASTPAAARQPYNEKDYEPTIDHAKNHQSRLATQGRNRTLPSDKDLAARAEDEARKKAEVKSVKLKFRFPDQSTVITEFSNLETTENLYQHVAELMENEKEPFFLNFIANRGPQRIPRKDDIKVVAIFEMASTVVVNVLWDVGARDEARTGKSLKEKYQEKASEVEFKEPESVEVEEKLRTTTKENGKQKQGDEKKGGVPKWLKLPGKK